MKRFRIVVSTGFVGADHEDEVEYEDDVWEAMSENERERALENECQGLRENTIETYWEEL